MNACSDDKDGFIMFGFCKKGRLLVVFHSLKENEIRIISARLGRKNELQLL